MWEMQILVNSTISGVTAKVWSSVRPTKNGHRLTPYRFDNKEDAVSMIIRLYSEASAEEIRVVFI